jgi:hypothetical protein
LIGLACPYRIRRLVQDDATSGFVERWLQILFWDPGVPCTPTFLAVLIALAAQAT